MSTETSNIVYQQPYLIWSVIAVINSTEYSLTDRLKNEPNIVDSLDYNEGISYVNEIAIEFNNEDGYLSNPERTGIFDNDDNVIELIVKGKLSGTNSSIKRFGGYVDSGKIRTIERTRTLSVNAYSYFGATDKIDGNHLTTRYIETNGLLCYNIGIHITRSNIQDKELKAGVHKLNSRIDGSNKQLQLDDGDWTTITTGQNTIIYNARQDQAVEVHYGTNFYEDKTQTIISKNKTDQYPYLYYYDANVFTLIEKSFEIAGIDNYTIKPYELQTWDERKFVSSYEQLAWLLLQPTIIISDFNKKLFVGNGNKVLLRNMQTQQWTTIFEDTVHPTLGCINLIHDPVGGLLFVYLGSTNNPIITFCLWKVDLNNNFEKTLLYDNSSLQNPRFVMGNSFNSFQYSQTLGLFVFKWRSTTLPTTYHISTLDINGNVEDIYTDPDIIDDGFNIIWEASNFVKYYFLQTVPGNIILKEMTYNFGSQQFSSPVTKINWRQSQASDNRYSLGTIFRSENKMFARELNQSGESFLYDFINNVYIGTEVFNPDEHKLLAPYEWDSRLYLVAYNTNFQKLSYLKNNVITYTDNLAGLGIFDFNYDTDLKKMCVTINEYNNEVFNFIDRNDNYLKRLSSWFIPYMNGELICEGKTLRNMIDLISNSYLGYFKISSTKTGYFTKREYYNSLSTLEIIKAYIKDRIQEKSYNEKYDRVRVSNKDSYEYYGLENFTAKEKSLTNEYLPTAILKDIAKFYYDYYSVKRKVCKINYIPAAFIHDTFDKCILSDVGLPDGIIHKVSPRRAGVAVEVLYKEVSE
jgi:hypothetical protein